MSAINDRLDRVAEAIGDVAVPPNPENFSSVLEAIISERSGPAAFSPSQIAAARRLARLLTDEGGRIDAPGLTVLQSLLPPLRSPPPAPAWDLMKLDDAELMALGRIICKVTGVPWRQPAGAAAVIGHGSFEFIQRGCDCSYCRPRTPEGEIIPIVHGSPEFVAASRCDCPECERARGLR
jgi:hypothetical protein